MLAPIREVAVIGAGVSGISSAVHLRLQGLRVTVFERSAVSGGVWVLDSRIPFEPAYPSVKPSVAEFAFYDATESDDPEIYHSTPGPCYEGLRNNVPTELMKLSLNEWKPNTPRFTTHNVLRGYLQDTAEKTGINADVHYHTRVEKVSKEEGQERWSIRTTTWNPETKDRTTKDWTFDAVVVASGHYHAPYVPNIPGLAEWKKAWPSRIQHSKRYRNPKGFDNQNVLIIGGSTSATDIAKELGPNANKIWQSTRDSSFDHPAFELPSNGVRIAEVASFEPLQNEQNESARISGPIPGRVLLKDGKFIENVDRIVVATGYHFSLPFLSEGSEYHRDDLSPEEANESVLVTNGTMMHNLHKDIFYIPDPSLAFVGVPFRVATWSLFEFQAVAVAALFSGRARLPPVAEQRVEYENKIEEKGLGKRFHALMGEDVEYVSELMKWANQGREESEIRTHGYSKEWVDLQTECIAQLKKYGVSHEAKATSMKYCSGDHVTCT